MDFTAFSHAVGNWLVNPCISYVIKYTIECESNWKKAAVLWVKYEYQFPWFYTYEWLFRIFPDISCPGFSHVMGFPTISHASGKWRENSYISHMMKYLTRWQSIGKKHKFYGKIMGANFPGIPHLMGFTMLWDVW